MNQTFTVTGGYLTVIFDANAANNRVTYTVTNAVAGANHRIALFDADDLTVDPTGIVTFAAQAGAIAARTAVPAGVISINGDTRAVAGLENKPEVTNGYAPTSTSFTLIMSK